MFNDFRSYFQIVQSSAQTMAKELHKPSLNNKESMANYAKAIGASGVKASFTSEQKEKAMVVEYVA